MSTIPHAFGVEGRPETPDQLEPASSLNATSDAELTAAAVAHDTRRMEGLAENDGGKGKEVENGGNKDIDPNKYVAGLHGSLATSLNSLNRPAGVMNAQWNRVLTDGGLPSNTFAAEKAVDLARWAALDTSTRDRSVGLREQVLLDFNKVNAAAAASAISLAAASLPDTVAPGATAVLATETPPSSPMGVRTRTPSSATRSIARSATAPAAALSAPLPMLPPGVPIVLPGEQAVTSRLHLEVPVESQSGKEVKESVVKAASRANANVLVLGRHLLQLKDSMADLSVAVENSNRLISVSNASLGRLQEAVDDNARRVQELSQARFPLTPSSVDGLRDLAKAHESTASQVDVLGRDVARLFKMSDAEFKKVWPAVNSLVGEVKQVVEARGVADATLANVLVDFGKLKVSVEGSLRKVNAGISAAVGPAIPSSFSFTSPFPTASGASMTSESSSLGKRTFDASMSTTTNEMEVALFMSPVILPSDPNQVLDAGALFRLYRVTVLPTYAPPAVVASFEANNTVLKVKFPQESFIDVFINLWNNSPRRHTDSLHSIKLAKRFSSVFPTNEEVVWQGSMGQRGGGFRGGRGRGGRGRGMNNMQFFR